MIAIKEREQYIVRMRICAHQFVGVVTNMGVAISKSHVAVRQTSMGKLNVALLRYLSREDFRVLTAVSQIILKSRCNQVH